MLRRAPFIGTKLTQRHELQAAHEFNFGYIRKSHLRVRNPFKCAELAVKRLCLSYMFELF